MACKYSIKRRKEIIKIKKRRIHSERRDSNATRGSEGDRLLRAMREVENAKRDLGSWIRHSTKTNRETAMGIRYPTLEIGSFSWERSASGRGRNQWISGNTGTTSIGTSQQSTGKPDGKPKKRHGGCWRKRP